MPKTAPSEEEFAAWRNDPVTAYVLEAYKRMAEAQRQHWLEQTWEGNHCDTYELCALRTRADAYLSMADSDLTDFIAAHEPEAE